MIRDAERRDLPDIAKCHIRAFPKAMSTKLGMAYVTKAFEWYFTDRRKFVLVEERDGKVVGYITGLLQDGTSDMGSASGMLQHAYNEAVKGLIRRPWLLFDPEIVQHYNLIFRNIRRRLFGRKKSSSVPEVPKSELKVGLVVMGVLPEYQGKGIGTGLLRASVGKSAELGAHKVGLTVRQDNVKAIRIYKDIGWYIIDEKVTDRYYMHMDV